MLKAHWPTNLSLGAFFIVAKKIVELLFIHFDRLLSPRRVSIGGELCTLVPCPIGNEDGPAKFTCDEH